MADPDGYLRSDVDKGETSPDPDGRLRSDADKVSALSDESTHYSELFIYYKGESTHYSEISIYQGGESTHYSEFQVITADLTTHYSFLIITKNVGKIKIKTTKTPIIKINLVKI